MVTVAEQMKRIPSAVRPTVQAARRTVKAIAPRAKEIAYQSARQPTLGGPTSGGWSGRLSHWKTISRSSAFSIVKLRHFL